MAKQLTSMYQDNYKSRCYMASKIIDNFRYDYIRLGVLGIISTMTDDLLKVLSSAIDNWIIFDDIQKFNLLVKFIKDRVIE